MRLVDIDTEQLARETVGAAVDRIGRIASAIDGWRVSVTLTYDRQPAIRLDDSAVGRAVYCLVHYARDGITMGASVAQECGRLQDVAAADMADPSTPLGLVVSAALAREAIDAGQVVSTARLAALASVGSSYVRNQVAAGVLRARAVSERRSEVTAADARRWLGARGVAGYQA